jgi:hypothetical protein
VRFHVGPVPESPEFRPEAEGWTPLREPSSWGAQLLALPLGFVVLALVLSAWWALIPTRYAYATFFWAGVLFLPMLPVQVVLHEVAHSWMHPHGGRSDATLFGFWPARLVFFVHYDGDLSRDRFLATAAAPFVILTLVPLALCAALSIAPFPVITLTGLNAVGASVDLLAIVLVASQVDRGAVVRNQGYRTWWRSVGA